MKHLIFVFTVFWMAMAAVGSLAATAGQPPPEGGVLPDIVLNVPQSLELQAYLGISGKKTFRVPEIQAQVVIIEIFSMY